MRRFTGRLSHYPPAGQNHNGLAETSPAAKKNVLLANSSVRKELYTDFAIARGRIAAHWPWNCTTVSYNSEVTPAARPKGVLEAMRGKVSGTDEHTLVYHESQLDPEDILNFTELSPFVDSWKDCGLTQRDLAALQILIMCDPRHGSVMPGTRGLRKLRYSPERWNVGKRDALRVCYVYFEMYGMVLLCLAFKKADLENLSAEGKRAVNRAIDRIQCELEKQYGF
jgi:hypothetical protein